MSYINGCVAGWYIAAVLFGWFVVNPWWFPETVPPHNGMFQNTGTEPLKIEVKPGTTIYLVTGKPGGGGR